MILGLCHGSGKLSVFGHCEEGDLSYGAADDGGDKMVGDALGMPDGAAWTGR